MKKLIVCLLTLALTASLFSGCGGGEANSAPTGSTVPEGSEDTTTPPESGDNSKTVEDAVNITVWHGQGGVNGQIIEELTQEFNNTVGAEKGITADIIYQDNIAQKMNTVVLADDVANMADVTVGTGLDVAYYRDLENLVWAEEMLAGDPEFTKDQVLSTAANMVTYEGRLSGIPFSTSAIMLFYNKDMFREAGLDPDSPPETLAQLAEYCEALLKTDDSGNVTQYGLAVTPDRWHVANWIGGQGAYSFVGNNESGRTGPMTEVVFGENGTMAKFLTEYGKVAATGGLQHKADQPREEFAAGQYAMVIQSSSRINQFGEMCEFDLGAAPIPKVDAGDTGGSAVGGGALYLLNRGDQTQIDAGWEYIKFMCSAETQLKWHTSTGYIPTNAGSYDLPELAEFVAENPMYQIPIDILQHSDPHVQEPMDPNPLELSAIYSEIIREFTEGNLTVDEAVDQMVTRCNEALDLYYRANPLS